MLPEKAIICDLDGTLCNPIHRVHHAKNKEWDLFHGKLSKDSINLWCLILLRRFQANDHQNYSYKIILITGRPEKYREQTKRWLIDNNISYERLYMRPNNDKRSDCEIKKEIYLNSVQQNYEVIFAIEDRNQVVNMWRDIGLTCLQCAEGNF